MNAVERAVLIDQVRSLHEPGEYYGMDCASCEDTSWPCPTAILVYTPAEITTMLASFKAERDAARKVAAIRRESRLLEISLGSPPTTSERLMDIYADPCEVGTK